MARRYLNLPDWKGLLRHFAELIRNDEFVYESYENIAKSMINRAGIITTNYDTFLEDNFKGFTKYVGQSQLIFQHCKELRKYTRFMVLLKFRRV